MHQLTYLVGTTKVDPDTTTCNVDEKISDENLTSDVEKQAERLRPSKRVILVFSVYNLDFLPDGMCSGTSLGEKRKSQI